MMAVGRPYQQRTSDARGEKEKGLGRSLPLRTQMIDCSRDLLGGVLGLNASLLSHISGIGCDLGKSEQKNKSLENKGRLISN